MTKEQQDLEALKAEIDELKTRVRELESREQWRVNEADLLRKYPNRQGVTSR